MCKINLVTSIYIRKAPSDEGKNQHFMDKNISENGYNLMDHT